MIILAHRANLEGPDHATENSFEATKRSLELGFGIETDLRRTADGQFYIAHDAQSRTEANDFVQFAGLFQEFPDRTIAMNVKELGYETELIALQASGQMGRHSYYFDFELLEPRSPGRTQRLISGLPGGKQTRMASRLSDRGESLEQCLAIPAHVVWADEFDSLWLGPEHVRAVHDAGREFYVISPEIHDFSLEERMKRWKQFKDWGIGGLCTDFALSAREFFLA